MDEVIFRPLSNVYVTLCYYILVLHGSFTDYEVGLLRLHVEDKSYCIITHPSMFGHFSCIGLLISSESEGSLLVIRIMISTCWLRSYE